MESSSPRDGAPDGGDDAILGRLVEIGVHRQADDLLGEAVGDRQSAFGTREAAIDLHAMQRLRIIDRGRDALGLERRRESVARARLDADGVLRPDRGHAVRDLRHADEAVERPRIALGDAVAGVDLVGEDLELLDQHRGLDGVEPRGEADPHVVIFVAALAVHPQADERLRHLRIVGEDGAAVAVAAERLRRKEARGGGVGERADLAVADRRAEALGGVVEHEQLLFRRDRVERVMLGRKPEQVDRQDHARREPRLLRGGDRPHDARRRDVEGRLVDVGEHRRGAEQHHHLRGRAEREGRADHRIARPDALRHQHQRERVGTARAAHHVPRAAELRQRLLERAHLGAENELAVIEDARDRNVYLVAEPATLRCNVDERNRRPVAAGPVRS